MKIKIKIIIIIIIIIIIKTMHAQDGVEEEDEAQQ